QRSEVPVAERGRARGEVREDRRRDEVARVVEVALEGGASCDERRLRLAASDVLEHLVPLGRRRERSQLRGRVEAVADAQPRRLGGEPLDELVLDRILDDQSAAGSADLAA